MKAMAYYVVCAAVGHGIWLCGLSIPMSLFSATVAWFVITIAFDSLTEAS